LGGEIMTHTFEVMIADLNLIGEVGLNDSGMPEICTDEAINMSLSAYKTIGDFLSKCAGLSKKYGEITKIEIKKK